jgi:carbonic anhydrase/acetyltransferase-like protein (isoleucine patch superfamily)
MGENPKTASIDAGAWVDPTASIGAHAVIKAGAYVCSGTVIGPEVHVGPNATFVEARESGGAGAQVERGASIGANATILPGIVIAAKAVVQPGAVVTRSVPPNAIVEGNPAAIVGYIDANEHRSIAAHLSQPKKTSSVEATSVNGVTVHRFPVITDLRGKLSVGEFERQIPFVPKRYFVVYDVPNREVRGEHAHIELQEFLVCLAGSCSVLVDDGKQKAEILLDSPNIGVYLPAMTWTVQYKYSADAILLVFASDYYESSDYIRDYSEFIARLDC